MKNERSENYDNVLEIIIPILKHFPHKVGGEGVAYFINDNLVVKEYCFVPNGFEKNFDSFCSEMQKLANLGIKMPKIYAWKIAQQINSEHPVNYYILEERIKSKSFYPSYFYDYNELYSDICKPQEFIDILKNSEANVKPFKEIVKRYQKAFINANFEILDSDKSVLDKFIGNVFYVNRKAKFVKTDLAPANVFRSDKEITFIDSYLNNKEQVDDSHSIIDLMVLLYANATVNNYKRSIFEVFGSTCKDQEFDSLAEQNEKLSYALANRIIDLVNQNVSDVKIDNKKAKTEISKLLLDVFDKHQTNKLVSKMKFTSSSDSEEEKEM